MPTLGKAYVEIRAKMDTLGSDLNAARGQVKTASGKMVSSVASIGRAATSVGGIFTAVFAGTATAAIYKAVEAASDLGEIQSKVEAVFGSGTANTITAWSENSARAMGLSKAAALDAIGTMGNMFLQLGATSDEAAGLSQEMVELASDLASFHNVAGGAAQVLESMQSAFRGEYDALQRYIPTINAAAVEHQALADSGKDSAKELTALDKALAAQKIILDSAGAAVGDYAKTSGELAGQQRILSAQVDDLQAQIGTALMPVMLDVVTRTNDWLEANGEWVAADFAGAVGLTAVAVRECAAAIGLLLTPLRQSIDAYNEAVGAFDDFFAAIGQVTGGVRGLDGELKTAHNGAQVYVGAIEDVRFAHEGVNEALEETVPTLARTSRELEAYAANGEALGRDMWLAHVEGSKDAAIRSNESLAQIRIEEFAREGSAMGRDMWHDFVIEQQWANERSEEMLSENERRMREYAQAGEALGQDMWLSFADGAAAASSRTNQAVADMQLLEYLEQGRTLGPEMWARLAEASEDGSGRINYQTRQMILESDNFFNGMRLGYNDLLENQYTWGRMGYDIVDDFVTASSNRMGEGFFNVLKGDYDSLNDAWDDLWDDMLRTVVDHVARIVAEWATVQAIQGADMLIGMFTGPGYDTGAYDITEDHIAMVHAGEMIIPADVADDVRSLTNGQAQINPIGGWDGGSNDAGVPIVQAAASSLAGQYTRAGVVGSALMAQGSIDGSQFTDAMTSMDFFGGSMIGGAFPSMVRNALGLTGTWARTGSQLMSLAASWGGFAPIAGVFGVGGAALADATGDFLNMREHEAVRDYFEDMYGWTGGRREYSSWMDMWEEAWKSPLNTDIISPYDTATHTSAGGTENPFGPGLEWYNPSPSESYWSDSNLNRYSDGGGGSDSDWDEGSNADENQGNNSYGYASGGVVDRLMVPSGEDGFAALQFGERVLSREDNAGLTDKLDEQNRLLRQLVRSTRGGANYGQGDVDGFMVRRLNALNDTGRTRYVTSSPVNAGM